jgi:RNA recognition motif-containing protein
VTIIKMADTHDKTGDIQLGENYEQRDVTHGGKATKDQQTRYKPYASSQSEEFKLFITNLPFDTDDAQLVDHVTKAGNIVSATVFRNPSGSSRGMG